MKILPRITVLIISLCFLGSLPGQVQAQSRVEENVVYGMYSGLALLMDIRYPEQANGIGVIVIPGSGWHMPLNLGSEQLKESINPRLSDALLGAGYTLFAINHRAAPRFRYPAAVEDAQRAVRFVRSHAADFGIDPDSIGAMGASSGGHLVNMLGALDGSGDPNDPDPVNRASSKVQSVVAMMAPSDLVAFARGPAGDKWFVASFLGMPLIRNDEASLRVHEEASPISYASPDDPPFLLIHGDADVRVPVEQSELFSDELARNGVKVEFITVPGAGHGFGFRNGRAEDLVVSIVNWFDSNLQH